MSEPDSDPWHLDDLDKAILDLDRETLKERLPGLALVPDLDAVDLGRFSRLARIYPPNIGSARDTKRIVLEPFESHLRCSIKGAWTTYYWDARSAAMHCPKAAALEDHIAKSLRAAVRGLRRRGAQEDQKLATYIETSHGCMWKRKRASADDDPFRRFLLGQLRLIHLHDGRLTFDRPTGTGTIIKFIDALRPLLPPRFVPTWAHPPSYIERLVSRARRKVSAVDRVIWLLPVDEITRQLFGGAPHGLSPHLLRFWRSRRRPSRGSRGARGAAAAEPQT
jgi:hypothetical protein